MSSITNPTEGEAESSINGNAMILQSPQGSFLQSPNMMFPPPLEFQSQFGFNNPPRLVAKRLIVQIGAFKMLKAIVDPDLTVQDLIHDILWKDKSLEKLQVLLTTKKGMLPKINKEALLTLSLGPTRSMELVVLKQAKGQLKFVPVKGGTSKKRKRNERLVVKLQLMTAESKILLCPRDPIYPLIESGENVMLQAAGAGSWEYPKLFDSDGPPAATEPQPAAPQEESQPAKRQKVQKEPPKKQPPQKAAASPTKKRKAEAATKTAKSDKETKKQVASEKTNANVKQSAKKTVDKTPAKSATGAKETNGAAKKAKTTTKATNEPTPKAKAKETPKAKAKAADSTTPKAKETPKAKAKVTEITSPKAKENPKPKTKVAESTSPKAKEAADSATKKKTSKKKEYDVVLGSGKGTRENPGNMKYSEFIESQTFDFDNFDKRGKVVDQIRNMFRFIKKEKGAKTYTVVKKFNKIVSGKIKRDLQNHFNRKKDARKANEEKKPAATPKTPPPAKESKPNASPDKQEESAADDSFSEKSEGKDASPPENADDGALSDETPQVEEKGEEVETNEKPSKDAGSETQEDDDNDNDESSSTSSSSSSSESGSSESSSSSDSASDDDSASEKSSSSKSDTSEIQKLKLLSQSQEKEATSADEENEDEEEEEESPVNGDDKEEKENDTVPKSVDINGQKNDDDSEDDSDDESDDSSTSSSSVSSDSSSSVSSSSSDDDSSSDSSSSSGEAGTKSTKSSGKKLTTTDSLAKLTPTKSPKKQVQPQSTASKRKRKPLLDPNKKIIINPNKE